MSSPPESPENAESIRSTVSAEQVVPFRPFTTNQDLDPVRLRQAFGVFPTGVVAVAAEVDGELVGLAASSFTSVSLDPPLVSISVASTSRTWPALRRAEHLGVTILAEHQGAVCRQLAGPVARRFADVDLTVTDDGAVVLHDGLASFDTTIYDEVQAGDHTIVLLRLHAVEQAEPDATTDPAGLPGPLVFHRSAFGSLA
ncbi:flavin reductase family protein [Nocardioides zeae]|uniref:Flavin reductase family protein n=1 Tax=Nocardioides imazamoxiresistens TaxID=3231893 RepID=A0ABU3Q0Q9_9ACTN|nr:flavin reductase family protein [Nocardioides zeae]MDT9595021.1 flavin reductase family protein [Nocardioides zeae]